jgi:carnitine O-acetyltransferase
LFGSESPVFSRKLVPLPVNIMILRNIFTRTACRSLITSGPRIHAMRFRPLSSSTLPSLPVPGLSETLEELKSKAGPHALNQEEFSEFVSIVNEFSKSTGPKLHELVQIKARQTSNWLSHDWWLNKAYLNGRDPLIIWSNPGLICPRVAVPSGRPNTIKYICHFLLGALDFKGRLARGETPDDGPVCMDQYTKVFGTTRIPGETTDSIRFGSLLNQSHHKVTISRNGNFFSVTLPKDSPKDNFVFLNQALHAILYDQDYSAVTRTSVGALTALPRTQWAQAFHLLESQSVNSIIDSDFVLCLDHVSNETDFDKDWSENMGRQILHADADNIGNRWFDKTLQLIVVLNQTGERVIGSGFCYEHTPAEGPPIVRLMEHSMKYVAHESGSTEWPAVTTKFSPPSADHTLSTLPFDLESNANLQKAVKEAADHHFSLTDSLDIRVLDFSDFGKKLIKEWKHSPDSFIQVAICWAYFRLHKTIGGCYESASTRSFAYGRTECVRSVTPGFFELTRNPNISTLRKAIEDHKNTVKRAATGKGIDRLLLGMNASAYEVRDSSWKWGLKSDSGDVVDVTDYDLEMMNRLYRNDLFLRSKYFKLSTSQVATMFPESFMVYGPLVRICC